MNSVGRVKEKLSQLDKKILRTVKKLKKSFIGSILLKLLSEIPLAILVGIAVYISTSLYTQNQTDTYQKNNLENIKIGVSYEYIESIFSIPEVDILSKEDGIRHCVHLLPNNTLFTFYDNNLLVAFFITIQSPNGSIDLAPYYQKNGLVLGKLAFSDVALPPRKLVPMSQGVLDHFRIRKNTT